MTTPARPTAAALLTGAWREMAAAYAKLGDAAEWLVGMDVPTTPAERDRVSAVLAAVRIAKDAINNAL